jgi:hypothetical protein
MMREWRGNVALEGVPTHVGALTECVEIKLDGQGNQRHPGRPKISLDSTVVAQGLRSQKSLVSGLNKA